jgi:hypothetical protein
MPRCTTDGTNMSDPADSLLTVKGAATFTTLAEQTIRNLTSRGKIPVLHIGRRCVYSRAQLLSWVLAQNAALAKKPSAKNRKRGAA